MATPEQEEKFREMVAEAARIETRVPGLKFHREDNKLFKTVSAPLRGYGGACPWQAEGTIDDKPFYARYRGDTAAMQVWDVEPMDVPTREGGYELDLDYRKTTWSSVIPDYAGQPYGGSVDTEDEVVEIMTRLIEALKPTDETKNPNSGMILAAMIDRMHDGK